MSAAHFLFTVPPSIKPAKVKPRISQTQDLVSFVMRETTGQDEEIAANLASGKGGAANQVEELVRVSIAQVNGQPVPQPYLAFDAWNSKARAMALNAYQEVNGLPNKDGEAFLDTAVEVAPVAPALVAIAGSSATG